MEGVMAFVVETVNVTVVSKEKKKRVKLKNANLHVSQRIFEDLFFSFKCCNLQIKLLHFLFLRLLSAE